MATSIEDVLCAAAEQLENPDLEKAEQLRHDVNKAIRVAAYDVNKPLRPIIPRFFLIQTKSLTRTLKVVRRC